MAWLDELDAAAHRWAPEFPERVPFMLAQLAFDLGDARVLTWIGLRLLSPPPGAGAEGTP